MLPIGGMAVKPVSTSGWFAVAIALLAGCRMFAEAERTAHPCLPELGSSHPASIAAELKMIASLRNDSDPSKRGHAARWLGKHGTLRSTGPLVEALSDNGVAVLCTLVVTQRPTGGVGARTSLFAETIHVVGDLAGHALDQIRLRYPDDVGLRGMSGGCRGTVTDYARAVGRP